MPDKKKLEDAEPSAKESEERAESPSPGVPHLLVRLLLGAAGLLLIIGFFLDWMNFPGEVERTVSGVGLVTGSDAAILAVIGADTQRWLLLMIPGFGVALTGVAVSGIRHSGPIAALLGILIVGYGIVMVIILFFQRTEIGLWLVLLGAFLAVATGVVAFVRSRDRKFAARSRTKTSVGAADDD